MSTRQRSWAQTVTPTGGGGSIPTFGNVVWGPDFGEPNGSDGTTITITRPVFDLEALALFAQDDIAVTPDLDALSMVGSAGTITSALDGSALGAPFWQSVGEYVSTGTESGTTLTVPKPTGLVVGDLMLAHLMVSSLNAVTFSRTGWTVLQQASSPTNLVSAGVLWRIADAADVAASSFAFTLSSGGNVARVGHVHRINATDPTTPINASAIATLAATALDTDPDSPSVTTTTTNCLVFAFLGHDHAALSQSHTPGASHIERADAEGTTGTLRTGSHAQHRVFAATGATGTIAHDCTESVATEAVMIRVAVAPGTIDLVP